MESICFFVTEECLARAVTKQAAGIYDAHALEVIMGADEGIHDSDETGTTSTLKCRYEHCAVRYLLHMWETTEGEIKHSFEKA